MKRPPRWKIYLRLGRVSNLPTVWTDVMAGAWLAGARPGLASLALIAASLSLFYVGGMFLNDAFDREIDAKQRPDRPIPAGHVTTTEVFVAGFALLAAGEASIALHGLVTGHAVAPLGAGLGLAAAIVAYDRWHKNNPLSPLLMGLCRALVYVVASLSVSGACPRPVLLGAAALSAHVVGLTYAAKQEGRHTGLPLSLLQRWPLAFLALPFLVTAPVAARSLAGIALFVTFVAVVSHAVGLLRHGGTTRVPRVVALLIAAISLLDALLVARSGGTLAVTIATLGFPLTLLLQRWIRGT